MRDWRPSCTLPTLRTRAAAFTAARSFMAARGILECSVPLLQGGANLDPGVQPLAVEHAGSRRWLITSPEHPLKRLVAAGAGAVYALCPCFRAGESGSRHNSEFHMLEWYRPGWDDSRLADEVIELLDTLTGMGRSVESLSWRQAYLTRTGLDPHAATTAQIIAAIPADQRAANLDSDRDAALDLLLVTRIEPTLGAGQWTILHSYPADRAAQAQLRADPDRVGQQVAARFEIYRNGLELANGYHELTDPAELRARLEAERAEPGRDPSVALDENYLASLPWLGECHPSGNCAGVAVGFDRVLMLALGARHISEVLPFADGRA